MSPPAQDPALLRSALAAAYLLVALLAARAARPASSRERTTWLAIAVTLMLLGAAKQISLQAKLTAALRSTFISGGWYASHHETQMAFVLIVGICTIAAGVVLARYLRNCGWPVRIASGTLLLFLAFAMLRAPSLHAVDVWTVTLWAGMRRGWWIELAALAVIGGAAAASRRR